MRIGKSLVLFLFLAACAGNTGNKPHDRESAEGVTAKNGMVVSAHQESSGIGAEILKKGGNAIDAAVATELALAVCFPVAGNIGGGGFMLIRTADGTIDAIDFREKAPSGASRDMYLDPEGVVTEGLSTQTHLASGVPGTIDGILEAHKKYGKLPFSEVIQPSIDLAENGFPVTKAQANSFNSNRNNFITRNKRWPAFVKDSLWKEGEILKQPELAATLRLIRDNGRNGFYSGKTAELIVKEMNRGKGLITEKDLADYNSVWRKPVTGYYRDYRIISMAPPSSGGIILLQLLGMIEKYPLGEWGFHSPASVHLMIEAERRAFADRAEYLGDPDFVKIPAEQLVDKKYLEKRMESFTSGKASLSSVIGHGSVQGYESAETTHFSVVDGSGNAVAVTTTLNGDYGNCIVVDGAGFLLNNEMDDFSSKPGFPNMYGLVGGEANAIAPGKRMLSSMTPTIVEKNGKLYFVLGSPGGSTIPTSVFQVIVNVIDFGMNMQEAVDAGRFHHQWLPDNIIYEQTSFDSTTIAKLASMGHDFKPRSTIGRVNAIMRTDDGFLHAGADPRGNNAAAGY